MNDSSLGGNNSDTQVRQAVKDLASSIEKLDTHKGNGAVFSDLYEALECLMIASGHVYAANIARRRSLRRPLKRKIF